MSIQSGEVATQEMMLSCLPIQALSEQRASIQKIIDSLNTLRTRSVHSLLLLITYVSSAARVIRPRPGKKPKRLNAFSYQETISTSHALVIENLSVMVLLNASFWTLSLLFKQIAFIVISEVGLERMDVLTVGHALD